MALERANWCGTGGKYSRFTMLLTYFIFLKNYKSAHQMSSAAMNDSAAFEALLPGAAKIAPGPVFAGLHVGRAGLQYMLERKAPARDDSA